MSSIAFPLVSLNYREWVSAVADCMTREIRPRPGVKSDLDWQAVERRAAIRSKAVKLLSCITSVKAYSCHDCGTPAEQSGRLNGLKDEERCHARSCPRCARIRSAQLKEWGERLQANIACMFAASEAEKLGYRLRFVTLTTRHDPSDADDHTVERLTERLAGLRDAFAAIWKNELDKILSFDLWRPKAIPFRELRYYRKDRRLGPDKNGNEIVLHKCPERVAEQARLAAFLGAWCFVELAGSGHVHLHVLFFGPWVDLNTPAGDFGASPAGWLDVGRRAFPDLGEVADVRIADGSAVAELAKYPLKVPGAAALDWLAGVPLKAPDGSPGLIHPMLAARWEIALHGVRISDKYGSFRSVGGDKQPIEPATAPATACPCCGAVAWLAIDLPLPLFLQLCETKSVARPMGTIRAKKLE
jgi:hypothetical protein